MITSFEVPALISAERTALLPRRKPLNVFEMDIRSDPRWERFVSAHPDALIYHHPGWLSALESEYGQKCVSLACTDELGQLSAVLPLLYTRGLPLKFGGIATGRRLSSLPRTPIAGPLALNQNAAVAIVEYAVEMARSQSGVQLEIKSQIPDLHESVEGLACIPWRPTFVEELPTAAEGKDWEDFWENLRLPRGCVSCEGCRRLRFGNAKRQHRINWAVNKARKLGLEVREADRERDLADWYQLYLLTMRHNAVPPRSYRLFQSLWSSLRSNGKMQLLLAEQDRRGKKRLLPALFCCSSARRLSMPLLAVPRKIGACTRMTFCRLRRFAAPVEVDIAGTTSEKSRKSMKHLPNSRQNGAENQSPCTAITRRRQRKARLKAPARSPGPHERYGDIFRQKPLRSLAI